MSAIVQSALLGLGLGAMYSLSAHGLIAVFRGSGILNFAQGAVGVVGAYAFWELRAENAHALPVAAIGALALTALLGLAIHVVVMRPLQAAAPIARMVATIGVLIVLQAAVILRYSTASKFVESELPNGLVTVFGTTISVDRFILVGIALALTMVLWATYRFTNFGRGTSAVAENQRAAAAIGLSPDRIAGLNWMLGSVLAGVCTILVVPIVTLQVSTGTNLMLAALAGALVAGFRSFPVAFAAGMVMGIVQTVLTTQVGVPGFASSVPFMAIVGWIVLTGRALPLRDVFLQRLPAVGTGRIRWGPLFVAVGVAIVVILQLSPRWNDALVVTFAMAIVLLSVVVLTGYTGQLSLAQFALAGFGAWVAGRAAQGWDAPFLVAVAIGVAATIAVGALLALPAVRARGVNLAIVTLGLGAAIEYMLFGNSDLVGGFGGITVGSPDLFGWSIDASRHPDRYAIVCLVFLVVVTVIVANLRRGRSGRRLLAVRTNERAAAALGINVVAVKVYAFALAGGIAAIGGVLVAFRSSIVVYPSTFRNFTSIQVVGWAFIGGIGFLAGPAIGATLAPGAISAPIVSRVLSALDDYIGLIAGGLLVVLVIQNQNGVAASLNGVASRVVGRNRSGAAARSSRSPTPAGRHEPRPVSGRTPRSTGSTDRRATTGVHRVVPQRLEVTDLYVRYGGVIACDHVGFVVEPGQVVGLIGPNGAGKTSVIDAVTGFTRSRRGQIMLGGNDVAGLSAARRARAGLSRSFQSLELFEDATVRENVQTAADPRDGRSYLLDLVWPVTPPLPDEVIDAIDEFGLGDVLDHRAEDLPYGQRRLLAIARAVATSPSVLLLDEPAAGLGDAETAELAALVRRLADERQMAVLLVEHDMNFVMSACDELVVLDFGRVIAAGGVDTVRNDPAVIAAYLGESEVDDEPSMPAGPAPVGGP